MTRRTIAAALSAVLILLFCPSCSSLGGMPRTVTLAGEEYRLAFTGELYPLVDEGDSAVAAEQGGRSYSPYAAAAYDCYIAYDRHAEPCIYFAADQYDEAVAHYTDGDSFVCYLLRGNHHDGAKGMELEGVDPAMLDALLSFAAAEDYDPFSPTKDEGLFDAPIPNPDAPSQGELHIYKESRDGAFGSSRGSTFRLHDGALCLLYYYDFADSDAPVMRLRSVPREVSDYFLGILEAAGK